MRKKTGIVIVLAVILAILLIILIKVFDSDKGGGGTEPSQDFSTGETDVSGTEPVTEPVTGFVGGGGGSPGGPETPEETTAEEPTEESTAGEDVELYGTVYPYDTERIDISGTAVEDIEYLAGQLSKLGRLTYVDMCDCGLSNEQMEGLTERFPNIKFVWKVTLGLWTIRTDCVAFSTLKDGTITYRLTNEDVKVLKYCTDMVALDLGHNRVTDISFLQYMPELRILILVDNRVEGYDDVYISDLSYLKYTPKLKYLEFFVGSVSDISFLQDTPELVDLNISYNPVSDVWNLMKLPKIERLYIEHTNLTEEDYRLLQETYPQAQIVYYGEGSVDQGWREHERYYAMMDMFRNNYVNELFLD